MKIIDETGAVITAPDMELGYLVEDTETVHHNAVEAVEEVSHYETVAEYQNGGKDVKKVVDVKEVAAKDAYDEEVKILRYIRFTEKELQKQFEEIKNNKIEYSKAELKNFLKIHPFQWIDGNYYSVTEEKQNQLNSNLALYQLSISTDNPRSLEWNCTGEPCTKWTFENLTALALAIGDYVQPIVAEQRKLEVKIRNCSTKAELDAIEITYDPVLTAYLANTGKEVVS